jgi:hypothetical protein
MRRKGAFGEWRERMGLGEELCDIWRDEGLEMESAHLRLQTHLARDTG